VYDEYAGLSVLAPKHGPIDGDESREHRVPHPNAQTHAHDFLTLLGSWCRSDFAGIADVTDADVHVSVETHRSSDVTTPESVANRGADMDSTWGETTALPHEVGNKPPAPSDPTGRPWLAEIRRTLVRTDASRNRRCTQNEGGSSGPDARAIQ